MFLVYKNVWKTKDGDFHRRQFIYIIPQIPQKIKQFEVDQCC